MRIQSECGLKMRALNTINECLFQPGINRDRFDQPWLGFILGDEIGAESAADLFGKFVGIFGDWGKVRNGFENEWEVSDGDAFAKQTLKDPLDDAKVYEIRKQFGDEGRIGFLNAIDEALYLLAAQDVMGDIFEGFR